MSRSHGQQVVTTFPVLAVLGLVGSLLLVALEVLPALRSRLGAAAPAQAASTPARVATE